MEMSKNGFRLSGESRVTTLRMLSPREVTIADMGHLAQGLLKLLFQAVVVCEFVFRTFILVNAERTLSSMQHSIEGMLMGKIE